ncbi:MAG: ABC transporter substrate-binding protein [Deltaproteobacteria bacterium]|nr:ABC transporter substrate-binding protein [Deltaproteobacteria bacterium]
MNIKKIIFVFIILFFGMTHVVQSAQPMDELKGPVEQFIKILQDPQYSDASKKNLQREKLWGVARKIFDFTAISRGTLTRFRWKSFTPEQRKDFTDVFTEFIGNTYFDKIQGEYHNEEVVFLNQEMLSETKARVMTKIKREALEIPVDYSMWFRKGGWKIFNVYVEGVSLLGNYRSEFERFLTKSSADELILELKKKIERQKKGEGEAK